MRFKISFLFIMIFISMLSLTVVCASDDMSQNMTHQDSLDDEDAVLSDSLYYTDDYWTSESVMMFIDEDNLTQCAEVTYGVGSQSGIVRGASVNFSSTDEFKHMIYATSKGTYDPATGIWDVGDFYGQESIKIFIYNDGHPVSWNDFKKTDLYSAILKDYIALNQTNKLINPNADDRIPYYVDLILNGNISSTISLENDTVVFFRNFTVESRRGIAENTIVEIEKHPIIKLDYYEATKGTYNATSGIWDVGDVYGPENLTLYLSANKTDFLSMLESVMVNRALARTTTTEINTLNNVLPANSSVAPVSKSDEMTRHYQLPHFEDYSSYRDVKTDEDDESEKKSYEEYQRNKHEDSNPTGNGNPLKNQTNSANAPGQNQNGVLAANQTNANGTVSQQNSNATNSTGDLSRRSIDKSIDASDNNIWIVLVVLILCLVGVFAYKKFKS